MQSTVLTEVFLPLALGIIMLGMGLSLTLADFKRVLLFPKATVVGLVCQLVILPATAFALLSLFNLPPTLAVGIMLLSFCPGGATSNLLSNLARADVALSITLTAIASIVTVFTIPFFINISMEYFMGEGKFVALPVAKTMLQIIVITIIPVSIGMAIRWKFQAVAQRAEKPVKIASALFIALIILGVIFNEKENLVKYIGQVGLITFLINLVILTIAYYLGKLVNLSHPQRSAIAIESGIQNGTLAIAIASSGLLLNNAEMAIPAAIYSLIMFATGGIAVYLFSRPKHFDS